MEPSPSVIDGVKFSPNRRVFTELMRTNVASETNVNLRLTPQSTALPLTGDARGGQVEWLRRDPPHSRCVCRGPAGMRPPLDCTWEPLEPIRLTVADLLAFLPGVNDGRPAGRVAALFLVSAPEL